MVARSPGSAPGAGDQISSTYGSIFMAGRRRPHSGWGPDPGWESRGVAAPWRKFGDPPDSAPAAGGAPARVGESIGSATMEADGTIVLQLRAETGSAVGDALFRYPPSHEEYVRIRAHVGPIEPGQSRPVPPFPDKAPARADPAGVAEALPPIEIDCAVDADCALSDIDIVGDACCPGCLTQVVNKRWKQRAEAFCAAHPAGSCPKKRCGEASPPTCRDGKCTNGA